MQWNREVNNHHCLPFDKFATDFQSSRWKDGPALVDVWAITASENVFASQSGGGHSAAVGGDMQRPCIKLSYALLNSTISRLKLSRASRTSSWIAGPVSNAKDKQYSMTSPLISMPVSVVELGLLNDSYRSASCINLRVMCSWPWCGASRVMNWNKTLYL